MSYEIPIRPEAPMMRSEEIPVRPEEIRVRPEEILIRPVTADDAGALLSIYAPYVRKTAITFEYEVPSEEEFRGRITRITKRFPYLAACRKRAPEESADRSTGGGPEGNEELLGYAYAGFFKERAAYDWACEVTIYVREDLKRAGIGRRLYEALETCLKAQGMRNLYACIGVPEKDDEYLTHDSVHFHERLGYRICGTFRKCGYKFGRWYDMCWMEKFLTPPEDVRGNARRDVPGNAREGSSETVPPVIPFPEMIRKAAVCGTEDGKSPLVRMLRNGGKV